MIKKLNEIREFEEINYFYLDNFTGDRDKVRRDTPKGSFLMSGFYDLNCDHFDCSNGVLIMYNRHKSRSKFGYEKTIFEKQFKFPEIHKDKFYLNSYDMKIYEYCISNSVIPIKPSS